MGQQKLLKKALDAVTIANTRRQRLPLLHDLPVPSQSHTFKAPNMQCPVPIENLALYAAGHGGQILGVPPSWLLSAGVFFLGAAVAALVISAIPLILVSSGRSFVGNSGVG